ncbi:MAG: hypothetical protein VKK04_18555 [Synechococcales bacterium]|nr:hypothetical protein [Synechococcales bacterium]
MKRKQEKTTTFTPLFDDLLTQLQEKGAIAISGRKNAPKVAIASVRLDCRH